MKLYISSDMEGVAGVCAWNQVDARTPSPEYAIYRRYYTQEVAAAIGGARATEDCAVLVNDAHGPMRNLLFEDLPPDVRVLFGNRKPYSMVQDADSGFDGAFFVGYHGGAGDRDAVLCHTYTPSVIHGVRVNGVRASEATLNAALLGAYGVPLMLVTGDRTTVEGVQRQMPWVEGAIVKESIGTFAAQSMLPEPARRLIAEAAGRAIARRKEMRLFTVDAPIALEIDLVKTEQADVIEMIPGFERTDDRAVRFISDNFPAIFRAFVATFRLGATIVG